MWKKKKAQAMPSEAKERELTAQSEPRSGGGSSDGAGNNAIAGGASPQANEAEKAAAASPEAVQRTTTVRQIDLALGQIVSVLMQSPQHKHYSLADLEWLVMPAVASGQFRIVQAQQSAGTAAAPVGVALWANVSADADKRLSDLATPARLRPNEWRSGDIPWLMELVCDARVQQALLKDIGETAFKGRAIKMRVRGADGKTQIGTLRGGGEAKPA
jgi:hemolysin-activating ACP:hemolysin acyltransferase